MYNAGKIFEHISNFPSCHGSTIVELPNGDLRAAWYAGSREGAKMWQSSPQESGRAAITGCTRK